ncbi:MAG: hypothetical protein H6Q90_284 [Deltaproteobacteria bacterium]|nr:hypothetical protein [Deltaproteobacteria bacterium]
MVALAGQGKLDAMGGRLKWLVMLGVCASIASGCSDKSPEFAGVGKYRFTKTTVADVKDGVCQPTELDDGRKATWCFALPPYKVANRVAEVDLYFAGTEPTAPLIEIQLKVRGCVEQDLETWMRTSFGPPIESRGARAYWKNSFLWAAALMPSEPGRCLVHFLPLTETAEIARIKQK